MPAEDDLGTVVGFSHDGDLVVRMDSGLLTQLSPRHAISPDEAEGPTARRVIECEIDQTISDIRRAIRDIRYSLSL